MDVFLRQVADIASTYSTDMIFVLGKGPSADTVDRAAFAGSLVIGLNDAERIFPADISIFHADWVIEELRRNGFKSRLYVAPYRFDAWSKAVTVAPYLPLSRDTADLMMQRFQSDEFVIEDVLFLSALKIALMVAAMRGRPQKVFMIGFDFASRLGYANAIGMGPALLEEDAVRVDMQEFIFLNTLYILRDTALDVIHVGSRAFSAISADGLNAQFAPKKDKALPEQHEVTIVAELTTNHFGDRNRLERMIRASAAAGADIVKLQKRDVASFYSAEQLASPYVSPFGKTFADYRYQLELNQDDFEFVDELCRSLDIDWYASVLDQSSFDWMQRFELKMVKLPSTISEHTEYLRSVAKSYSGSVVLSTGMTNKSYEEWVLELFVNCKELYLLQCNSAYPTPLRDCHIGVVRHYDRISQTHSHLIPGYSSHDIGHLASVMAVAAGARMVEKHVKLGNTDWAHFDAVAVDLTTAAFRDYVDRVREAELIVGLEEKKVNESENHKYWVTGPMSKIAGE